MGYKERLISTMMYTTTWKAKIHGPGKQGILKGQHVAGSNFFIFETEGGTQFYTTMKVVTDKEIFLPYHHVLHALCGIWESFFNRIESFCFKMRRLFRI